MWLGDGQWTRVRVFLHLFTSCEELPLAEKAVALRHKGGGENVAKSAGQIIRTLRDMTCVCVLTHVHICFRV